ncbi:MAG: tetratricopeptide repeat protein, partial [Deltaproteobacteria bacterium]|nr:tetratricopeptide repeat protein [Deltaproteobacteria bacterium]
MIDEILSAERLAQNGLLAESRDAFREILTKEPDNARSLMGLGIVCFKLGDNQDSIAAFKRILEIKNNHVEALKHLTMAYAADKDETQAMETIDKLTDIRKKDHEAMSFAAKIIFSLGKKEKALDCIDSALELSTSSYMKQIEYNDIKAAFNGLPLPSKTKTKHNLTVCCVPTMDSFIHEDLKRLSLYFNCTASVSTKPEEHIKNILNANIVWLEWGNQLTKFLLAQKNVLANKRVFVRIHSYELYDGLVEEIDYTLVSDIVLVSNYMKDLFINKHLPT